MKKRMPIFLAVLLIISLLAGCANTAENPGTSDNGAGTQSEAPANSEAPGGAAENGDPLKVALLLTGTINDASYNQQMFEAGEQAKEEYGVELAYTESIALADMQRVVQDYAASGYDLLIANGFDFNDAIMSVAEEFPDTKFAILAGSEANGSNVASYRHYTPHVGFLAGAISALKSQTNVVSIVAGMSYPHVVDAVNAFEAGAKYINPDCQVISGYIESWTDSAKAKEMTAAAIEQGADMIYCSANAAALGAYEAIEEASDAGKEVYAIGATSDMYETAPDIILVSVIQSQGELAMDVINDVMNDSFTGSVKVVGIESHSIRLSDWHGHDSWMPDGAMEEIDTIIAGLQDGSFVEEGICPKSTYDE